MLDRRRGPVLPAPTELLSVLHFIPLKAPPSPRLISISIPRCGLSPARIRLRRRRFKPHDLTHKVLRRLSFHRLPPENRSLPFPCPWKTLFRSCHRRVLSLAKIRIAERCLNAPMQKPFKEKRRLAISVATEIHWPLEQQMPFELSARPVVRLR
jgi:hypothetical protein